MRLCLNPVSGHSGKFSCIYCEGVMSLEPGKLRTFGSIIQHNQDYVNAGSPVSRMQDFKACINMPLLDFDKDSLVEEEVPPPELHLLMGGCNVKLEVIREVCAREGVEEQLWTWCSRNGITRRGYNGKNKLDGNKSNIFLSPARGLTLQDWWPVKLEPVVDCLEQLEAIKDKTFSWELEEGGEDAISLYQSMFAKLQVYCASHLGFKLSCT